MKISVINCYAMFGSRKNEQYFENILNLCEFSKLLFLNINYLVFHYPLRL